jgi:hypothetical protein
MADVADSFFAYSGSRRLVGAAAGERAPSYGVIATALAFLAAHSRARAARRHDSDRAAVPSMAAVADFLFRLVLFRLFRFAPVPIANLIRLARDGESGESSAR